MVIHNCLKLSVSYDITRGLLSNDIVCYKTVCTHYWKLIDSMHDIKLNTTHEEKSLYYVIPNLDLQCIYNYIT